jgi:hypothetical protein
MAQRPPDPLPFTVQEYHQALRLFMPDADASVMAQGMAGLLDMPEPTGGYSVSGGFISDDLLIVLSLLSEELRDKVDRYRQYDPRYGRAADQREWEARRAELKRLLDSGELKPPE